MHYTTVNPYCSNFRIITAVFRSFAIPYLHFVNIITCTPWRHSFYLLLLRILLGSPWFRSCSPFNIIIYKNRSKQIINQDFLSYLILLKCIKRQYEPRHDKTNKMAVRPTKTQISLGIRPVWSESSLSAWRSIGSLATHRAHSVDSDQSGQMQSSLGAHLFC